MPGTGIVPRSLWAPKIMKCTSIRRIGASKVMSWRNTMNTPQLLTGFLRATALPLTGQTAAPAWSQKDGIWRPALVILRINHVAIFVKRTPLENKFSAGSRARLFLFIILSLKMAGGWVSTLRNWFALQPPALTGIPTMFGCLQPHVISNGECFLPTSERWMRR